MPPPYYDPRADEIINFLTNLNPNTYDPDTASAQRALTGGGFSGARQYLERDKDRRGRFQEALPFLQLKQQSALQTQGEQAALNRDIEAGRAAMERLQLSERGETERLTMQEAARMRELIQQGNDAMNRLQIENQYAGQRQLQEGATRERLLGVESRYATERQNADIASRERMQQAGFQNSRDLAQMNSYDDNATNRAINDMLSRYRNPNQSGGQSGTGMSYGVPQYSNQPQYGFGMDVPSYLSGTLGDNETWAPIGTGNTDTEGSGASQTFYNGDPFSGNYDSEQGAGFIDDYMADYLAETNWS